MGTVVALNSMTSARRGGDVDVPVSGFPDSFIHTKRRRINRHLLFSQHMYWLILLFVAAISYWMWVQQDDQRRVDEAVEQRKKDWKREQENQQRAREQLRRRKQIELVESRLH